MAFPQHLSAIPIAVAEKSTKPSIQVIERMMHLLDVLSEHSTPATLKQLATATKLHPSTAHRILGVMVDSRLVDRIEPGMYRLGIRLVELGSLVKSRISVRQEALPHMHELHRALGETVNLSVRRDDEVVYIERTAENSCMMRVVQIIGTRAPLHITAVGKIFLAAETSQRVAEYVSRTGLPRFTDHTLTDAKKLGAELELFMFSEKVGQGLPMWLPKGTAVRQRLEDFLKNLAL